MKELVKRNSLGQFAVGSIGAHRRHGQTKTHFYKKWAEMRQRCLNKNNHKFPHYGGRGIKCFWERFEDFYEDMHDSYLEHLKENGKLNTTIDRIDVNGNYCKENCRWATQKTQQRNRRNNTILTIGQESMSIAQWAEKNKIRAALIHRRLKRGVSMEQAVSPLKWEHI